jgi:hypothetical protein
MSVTNRPSRSGPTRHWLDYLDAQRDALAAASAHDALALRFEITIAESELLRRGLPPHALELPDRWPEPPETSLPRPWASPEAQLLFGKALVKTGQKFKDKRSILLGWGDQRVAREQNRGGPDGPGEEAMKLPDDCPHALMPRQPMRSEPLGPIPCCRADGRALMLAGEEPLCRTLGSEAEVYRFIWRSSFDGDAVVRIGRQGDAITLRWRYDWFRVPAPDDAPAEAALSFADWARLQDALIATDFWALDPVDEAQGLDGAQWFIEGRRGKVYRGVSRWSPRGAVHALGRLLFVLAGPPLSKVELY